jgi:hypothetical protein
MIRFYVPILLLNPNPWWTHICVPIVSNFQCAVKILSLSFLGVPTASEWVWNLMIEDASIVK